MGALQEGVVQKWARDVTLRPGVDRGELELFVDRHGFELPDSLRDLYLLADGSSDCIDYVHFWPLDEIAPVEPKWRTAPEHRTLFGVADYLVHSHAFAIQLDPARHDHGAVYINWYSKRHGFDLVALDYEELLGKYVDNSALLCVPSAYVPPAPLPTARARFPRR